MNCYYCGVVGSDDILVAYATIEPQIAFCDECQDKFHAEFGDPYPYPDTGA